MSKTFQEVIDETSYGISLFEKVEKRKWGIEGSMIELSKQVGELSKGVMMMENYYLSARDNVPEYTTDKSKLADELWDIFFMTVRIANYYGIDLEKEHEKQMGIIRKEFGVE